jgi:hypothetical protein
MRTRYNLPSDIREQLNSVYFAERQDDQNSGVIAFAIVAAALTYAVAVGGFLLGRLDPAGFRGVPPIIQMLLPIVPMALISYLALNLAGTLVRSIHLKDLESVLGVELTPSPPAAPTDPPQESSSEHEKLRPESHGSDTILEPSFRTDVTDIYELKLRSFPSVIYAICTMGTYLPIALTMAGFTILVLTPGVWTWNKVIVAQAYLLFGLAVIVGLALPALGPERLRSQTGKRSKNNKNGGGT